MKLTVGLPKKRKAARGTPTVLLVGPMGSGKTALFTKVRFCLTV